MKPPVWFWFIVGFAMSSLFTASSMSMVAASGVGRVEREVHELKAEMVKLRSAIGGSP